MPFELFQYYVGITGRRDKEICFICCLCKSVNFAFISSGVKTGQNNNKTFTYATIFSVFFVSIHFDKNDTLTERHLVNLM